MVFLIVSPFFPRSSPFFTIFHGKDLAYPGLSQGAQHRPGRLRHPRGRPPGRGRGAAARPGHAAALRGTGAALELRWDHEDRGRCGDGRYPWEKLGGNNGIFNVGGLLYYRYSKILSFFLDKV